MAAILGLVSIDFLTNAWVGWSDFFGGSLGVTGGRFLPMISSATHPRWPLRPPSWISFPLIRGQTPWSIDPIFQWLIGGDWRKVPFDDQLCCSSKMAAMTAMLDLVSIDLRASAWVD
jgi:hypothetical protein